jgi:hypothetical protein
MYKFRQIIDWATVWATFSETHLVTLLPSASRQFDRACSRYRTLTDRKQGCQMVFFSYQKSYLGMYILEGLGIKNLSMFYGHLVHFMAICYILWQFGTFYGHLEKITAIWYILWLFGIHYSHLVYFMAIWKMCIAAIWYILWPFGIHYSHLVYIMAIWNTLRPFVIFYGYLE